MIVDKISFMVEFLLAVQFYKSIQGLERISALQESGISEAEFERIRKKHYGRTVMQFNDIESIANNMVSSYFRKESLFDDAEILQSLTLDEVNARLRTAIDVNCRSLTVIKGE